MRKLSIQIHAMPEEVAQLLENLLIDDQVFVTVAEGSPLQFSAFASRSFGSPPLGAKALLFTLAPPTLGCSSISDFRKLNVDALIFEIGRLTDRGLSESWLSAMTDDSSAMKRWKQAARHLRDLTMTGAVAVNPHNGASAPMKGHRFTKLALENNANGLLMLPAAGNSVIQLKHLK